jgi:anti-sigma factor RsiW
MSASIENDPRLLVHAYVDGELDPAHALELEQQLARDPALAAERERIDALRQVIKERLPPLPVPLALARRIEAAVGTSRAPVRAFSVPPSWRALAASLIVTACLASSATWFVVRPAPAEATADMVVASHLRALMAPQPIDVVSSDRHTVKPWFNGRVTEAPRVIDLSQEGFPLVGGRVDVIGRTPVPTLVYRRRQHLISLLALPSSQPPIEIPSQRTIAGYHIVTWRQNGVTYWAVSDVAMSDLETFAKLFRETPA